MKTLIVGFSIIITLIISLGTYSLSSTNKLSKETTNLYEHPFKVSNAVKEININLISMHRYMKDVVLSENAYERNLAIAKVAKHEQQAINQFEVVLDKYLGDKKEVHELYNLFISWKPIRQKVVELSLQNRHKEAANITKDEGAKHVQKLNVSIHKLLDFAEAKADTFYNNAQIQGSGIQTILTTLLVIVLVLSSGTALMVIISTRAAEKKIKKQLHLIDQNIMIATLNTKGNILEITNEFARYIDKDKGELIGSQSNFFLGDDSSTSDVIHRTVMSGKTWEGEIKRVVKGNETQHFHAQIIPNFDEKFEITSFTNIIHDISDKKALEILSITDKLTNLFNRRHFDVTLPKELAITKRTNSQLALVIIDIDYFKKYNDKYGHPAGDKVLALVAKTLSTFMKRPNDYLFRLGGEEFGIIFTATHRENSIRFLREIKESIEALHIPHCESDVSDSITISIGAKFIKGDEITSIEELYQEADEALYRAKEKRNAVVVIDPIMIESLESSRLVASS